MHQSTSCFKDILRRRRSASVSNGRVLHSLYLILNVTVIPCPNLDDFHCDGSRCARHCQAVPAASVDLGTNRSDSVVPAYLSSDLAVLDVHANKFAIVAPVSARDLGDSLYGISTRDR